MTLLEIYPEGAAMLVFLVGAVIAIIIDLIKEKRG